MISGRLDGLSRKLWGVYEGYFELQLKIKQRSVNRHQP